MSRPPVVVILLVALAGSPPRAADPPAAPAAPLPTAAPADTAARELGYVLGHALGRQIRAEHEALEMPIDMQAMADGLADAVRKAPARLDEATFKRVLRDFETRMQERGRAFQKRMAEAAKENLAKGAAYLEKNGRKQGVVTLPSGLQYEVLRQGTGPRATLDDVVIARYRGTRIDGSQFDATEPEEEPATFPLREVVRGWQEALQLMPAGSVWRIHVPAALGYGPAGSPPIEPNEALIFEIEFLGVQPAAADGR